MKKPYLSMMLFCCLSGLVFSLYAKAPKEPRVALVIGNSHYQSSPLANPGNDAKDMAAKLKKLGFKVTLKLDASQKEMVQVIRDFGAQLRKQRGVGLFYFAGHGMQVRGENYLLPIGADILAEDEIAFESINVNRVMEKMDLASSRINIVILDACRNNPFERSFRSASRGLAQMKSPSGTLIAFATEPGNVAMDGDGRNGIYTQYLLKHMDSENTDIGRMFRKVRADVMKVTNNNQTPWESTSLTSDFFFNLTEKKTADTAPTKIQTTSNTSINDIDLQFWRSIEKLNKKQYYQSYLKEFPNGNFAQLARLRIKELSAAEVIPAQPQTQADTSETPVKVDVATTQQITHKSSSAEQGKQHKQISQWLGKARRSMADLRLTTPKASCANYYYQKVLAIDPEHPEALQGIDKIAEQYISWSKTAIDREDFNQAATYLDKAANVKPNSREVLAMRALIRKNTQMEQASGEFSGKLHADTALLAMPLKGKLKGSKYNQARARTVKVISEALAPHYRQVKVNHKQQSRGQNLRLARKQQAAILVIPELLHWEDRNTFWSGRPDRISLKLSVIDVRTGKAIRSKLFELSGKWSMEASSSNKPDGLLIGPLKSYFDSSMSKADM